MLGYICPQALPPWFISAVESLGPDAHLYSFDSSGRQQNEDCLFLDVFSPVKIFMNAKKRQPSLAPVVVRIHGGGHCYKDKTSGDPRGLLENGGNGFVFVSMNYRVKAPSV